MPVTFAVQGDIIVIAIDHKPKRSTNLKRLRNIVDNPRVSLLVDRYDDDWSQLWWVRADGVAAVLEEDTERAAPLDWLAAKYKEYRQRRPAGPVILDRGTALARLGVWRRVSEPGRDGR